MVAFGWDVIDFDFPIIERKLLKRNARKGRPRGPQREVCFARPRCYCAPTLVTTTFPLPAGMIPSPSRISCSPHPDVFRRIFRNITNSSQAQMMIVVVAIDVQMVKVEFAYPVAARNSERMHD